MEFIVHQHYKNVQIINHQIFVIFNLILLNVYGIRNAEFKIVKI